MPGSFDVNNYGARNVTFT